MGFNMKISPADPINSTHRRSQKLSILTFGIFLHALSREMGPGLKSFNLINVMNLGCFGDGSGGGSGVVRG